MICSSRIIIRPFGIEDGDAFYEAAIESLSTVGRWLPWCHDKFSSAEALGWIAECRRNLDAEKSYDFGIFSLDTNRLLGGISINQINTNYKFGNIGYWVRESEQGKGIATEAARLIISYGFNELKLTRLEIAVIVDNIPSRRVAESLGATLEGIARNRLVKNGSPCAAAIYSLVPP